MAGKLWQIYPELNKNIEEGLIEISGTEAAGKVKREKIKYKITPKGEKEFKQWMGAENEKDTVRSEFQLKMFLSSNKNVKKMRKHIIQFKEQSEEKLKLFNLFYAQLSEISEMHSNHKNILCVLNLGMRQAELYIDWSKEMLERLGKKEK